MTGADHFRSDVFPVHGDAREQPAEMVAFAFRDEFERDDFPLLWKEDVFRDRKRESRVVTEVFRKEQWLDFDYYAVGLLSLPKQYQTDRLVEDWGNLTQSIWSIDKIDGLKEEDVKYSKRLAEQTAINIALQTNLPPDKITALQKSDDIKDYKTLKSTYYSCNNQVY